MAKIIYNKEDLNGTLYVEIQPGKFKGEHWSETSVFLDEEAFGYLLPSIKKWNKNFSYYSFNNISRFVWEDILKELEEAKVILKSTPKESEIEHHIEFIEEEMNIAFKKRYKENLQHAIRIIDEFQRWMYKNIEKNEYIAVLGI